MSSQPGAPITFNTIALVSSTFVFAVAAPLVGAWWPALLLIAFSLLLILLGPQQPRIRIAMLLTVLGGYIAVSSAVVALVQLGADPAYEGRAFFGWVALGCGATATSTSLAMISRPRLAFRALLTASLAGSAAVNLFSINTFYVAALPLWWAAALLIRVDSLHANKAVHRGHQAN